MDPAAQFGENLRRLRLAAGLTQEALSDATQLNTSEISRLERGVRNPRLHTMLRVARGLGVPLAALLTDIE